MIGSPHINVNMTNGKIRSKYNDYKTEYATLYPTYDGMMILDTILMQLLEE